MAETWNPGGLSRTGRIEIFLAFLITKNLAVSVTAPNLAGVPRQRPQRSTPLPRSPAIRNPVEEKRMCGIAV